MYVGQVSEEAAMSDKISDERLAELIDEHGGYETNSYVMPSTLRMGELESALRELVGARAEIERLQAQLAALAEAGTGYSQQTVDAITKEREALRKDAARYRWLNSQGGYVTYADPETNDAYIDAALAAQEDKP